MLPVPPPLQIPSSRARVDKRASEQVFKVRRPSLPRAEGVFQSRIIRSGSGCLGSARNVIFSLPLAGLRGTSCGKQSPFLVHCRTSVMGQFFYQKCRFLMSPIPCHLSQQH